MRRDALEPIRWLVRFVSPMGLCFAAVTRGPLAAAGLALAAFPVLAFMACRAYLSAKGLLPPRHYR